MSNFSVNRQNPVAPGYPAPPPPKITRTSPSTPVESVSRTPQPSGIQPPKHPAPKPPLDLSNPQVRSRELSSISDPHTVPHRIGSLPRIIMSGPSQSTRNAKDLVGVMTDPKFAKILKTFSPSLGQRLLQAFGKSKGSIDGGRFKKTVMRMLPLINIGVYSRDTLRAQKTKTALTGIADRARQQNNQLAQQLAEVLGGHQTSKRNTQIISGVVSVATTAVAFIPGTQLAPTLTGASSLLSSSVTTEVGKIGVNYSLAMGLDSGIKTLGSTLVSTGASYAQDYLVNSQDSTGQRVGKIKMGSGYGKLKVSSRQETDGSVSMRSEMGYQAARALINYLGPQRGPDEAPDSPRMQLRASLGATDPNKTYEIPKDDQGHSGKLKKSHREELSRNPSTDTRTDFLQMFFDIGVKGASLPYEE